MKKLNTLMISLFVVFNSLFAQDYFQQEVNYKIDVQLDDQNHCLTAYEEIEYINNSPHTLDFLYFHLWPNAYKNNETALAKQKREDSFYDIEKDAYMKGYIDSIDFKIDGKPVKWEYDDQHIDICKIYLKEPVKPNQKIIITTPFRVKIPSSRISRLGHFKQSYQITQWYPKPAVYDKYGWHPMPYLNKGEFYSEFGSFDVSITLPKNYVVGATGDLQNEEEMEWLNQLAEETAQIKSFNKSDNSFPKSDSTLKTIRFKQSTIHDFAWFADKRFHVLKGEQELPESKRKVTCWAMFLNRNADLWTKSIEYIGDALHYYSQWYGEYPYNQCTAVHSSISAGGGMEYPNITVIGNSSTDLMLEMVIMHEVGHNWFYGILGFNEREFPWQDEGINSFSEARYMKDKYQNADLLYKLFMPEKIAHLIHIEDLEYKHFHYLSYILTTRYNIDQKASLHSNDYTMANYGQIIYHKTSAVFHHLHNYLGEEKFNEIMQEFYDKWKFKHPYPEDVKEAFEEGSEENLDWVFEDLLNSTKKLDYKVSKLKDNTLLVKNKAEIAAPFPVSGIKNNEEVFTIWYPGFKGEKEIKLSSDETYDYIKLDAKEVMPEINRGNNYIQKKGLLKKVEPLNVQFAGVVERPEYTNLYILPTMGWNEYNNYMMGVVFYNSLFPRTQFEYQLAPMYGFGNKNLAGSGHMAYHILPYNSTFREVTLSLHGKRYAFSEASDDNFHRLKTSIEFHFRNKDAKSKISNSLLISGIVADDMNEIILGNNPDLETFVNLSYIYNNKNLRHPSSANVNAQYHKDFIKLNTELNYAFRYSFSKSINLRFFAGTFLSKSDDYSEIYNYNLSGTPGFNDYTYDHVYFGRFEDPTGSNLFGKQFVMNDGGFTVYAPHFTTSNWMLALNASAAIPKLPGILNFHVYGNIATYGNSDDYLTYDNSDNLSWEMGLQYKIGKEFMTISLPLFMSKQLEDYSNDVHDNFGERIRFTINVGKLNPFKLMDEQFL